MNGVLQFISGASLSSSSGSAATTRAESPPSLPPIKTTAPLAINSAKPTWPPASYNGSDSDSASPSGSFAAAMAFLTRKESERRPFRPSLDEGSDRTSSASSGMAVEPPLPKDIDQKTGHPSLDSETYRYHSPSSSFGRSSAFGVKTEVERKPTRPSIDEIRYRQSPATPPVVAKHLPTSSLDRTPLKASASLSSTPPPTHPIPGPSRYGLDTIPPDQPSPRSILSSKKSWKRTSNIQELREEMTMSLLASEAIIDSRGGEILSAQEVETLKNEQEGLASRIGILGKKLAMKTKMRDAAINLSRLNSRDKSVSKRTSEELAALNATVETVQKELSNVRERAHSLEKKLLEHNGAVLAASLRFAEGKSNGGDNDSGYGTSFRSSTASPSSPATSASASQSQSNKNKFEGPHLFAGHAGAIQPTTPRPPPKLAEVDALEANLKNATERIDALTQMHTTTRQELLQVQSEKTEVERSHSNELRLAEERILKLESDLHSLQRLDEEVHALLDEKEDWERGREELEEKREQVEALERRLEVMEEKSGEAFGMEALLAQVQDEKHEALERKDAEIERLKAQWDAERVEWERQKLSLESEKSGALAKLKDNRDSMSTREQEACRQANVQLRTASVALRTFMQSRGVVHQSTDVSISGFVASLESHLDNLTTKVQEYEVEREGFDEICEKLENEVRVGSERRDALARNLEDARRERDEAKQDVRALEEELTSNRNSQAAQSRPRAASTAEQESVQKLHAALKPLWTLLPSPEARAARLVPRKSSPLTPLSPSPLSPITPSSPKPPSLSDMDVRTLRTLYEPSRVSLDPLDEFNVEALVARVQALIADDKALIERLVRFAQAHELLKRNAERAQKLAQESHTAVETYQRQVKALEENNSSLANAHASMIDEIQELQDTITQITAEKRELESQAAEQGEEYLQLTEANNTLSARALALAEEAAAAGSDGTVAKELKEALEKQLTECRSKLEDAMGEIEAMRQMEQTQNVALLDELNEVQNQNGKLRAQLRAAGKL